jgi:hypothetical protein
MANSGLYGLDSELDRVSLADTAPDPTSYTGVFAVALQQASAEVREVINILISAPQETLDVLLDGINQGECLNRRHRHTINARLRKLCGLPQGIDFITELRNMIT